MVSLLHLVNRARPHYTDYRIIRDDHYFELDVDRLKYLLTEELRFFAEQLQLPNFRDLERDDLIEKLRQRVVQITIFNQPSQIESPNSIPIYLIQYGSDMKYIYRTLGGRLNGLEVAIRDTGILYQITGHQWDYSADLTFNADGYLVERYDPPGRCLWNT